MQTRYMKRALAGAVAVMLLAGTSHAVVDQQNPPAPLFSGGFNSNYAGYNWQQEVQTGIAGQLVSVELFYQEDVFAILQNFGFYINRGAGWQSDASDFSATVMPTVGSLVVDVSSANLSFAPGEKFVIGIQGLGPNNGCCNGRLGAVSYAPGALYINGALHGGSIDIAFVTNVIAVPEPETYALMLAGLAALAARRRPR